MKISVVTVCFNAINEIESTMLSVLNQTYHDVEYIVIDGGSTDGTVEVIKKYADRIAYWVSEPDKGIYDAMNKGIAHATGEYINFMNAGDRFFNECLIDDIISDLPQSNFPDVIYGDWLAKFNDGYEIYHANIDDLKYKMALCHQAIFVRSDLLRQFPFDISFKYAADFNQIHNLYINNCIFYNCNKYIALYDRNGVSSSKDNVDSIYREYHRILDIPFSKRKFIIFKITEFFRTLLYPIIPNKLLDIIRNRPIDSKRHYQLGDIKQLSS